MAYEEILGASALGILAGVIVIALIIGIAVWLFMGFAMMAIAKRLKVDNGWFGFIPILNIYLTTQLARKEWWWLLIILFAGFIPIFGAIASVVVWVYMWWCIAENLKKPGWWSILTIIPIANIIIIGNMAWGKE
ncbi:hypothetical protein H6504_00225 [Candidatus Woesearchaeota archaeon]|nr:hypothetical protein [Candidatus Woesearchaeota archaeon]